jgi:predicted ATPase
LPIPDRSRGFDGEELESVASIALFTARGRQVASDFTLTSSNARAVADICDRLEGLPLAIELAAVHIGHFPPYAIAAKLDHRLELLTGGPRDAPSRQHTLRDTIAWSYDLLSSDERRLFRALSVVCDGADEAATAAIWKGVGESNDPTQLLLSLVDKNLLEQSFGEPDGLRVAWLETIREFGLQELEATGEAPVVRRAHARYFLHLAEKASASWDTADATVWLDRSEREHANLRAAFDWFVQSKDSESSLQLAGWLSWFWRTRDMHGRVELSWRPRSGLNQLHRRPQHERKLCINRANWRGC